MPFESFKITDSHLAHGTDITVLNVIKYSVIEPPTGVLYGQTVENLMEAWPEVFDPEVTVFCDSNDTLATMSAIGFQNIMWLEDGGWIELSNGYRFKRDNGLFLLQYPDMVTEPVTITSYMPGGYVFSMPGVNSDIWNSGYIMTGFNIQNASFMIRWSYAMQVTQQAYDEAFEGAEPPDDPEYENDPFAPGGSTGGERYDGDWNYTGDPPGNADNDVLPSIDGTEAGFITIFNPTTAQLKELSSYLWSNNFDINTFKKIFNNPIDLVLGLSIVPVAVPAGGMAEVGIGYVGTGIYMTKAATRWVTVQCGTVTLKRFTGSYLDFDPYVTVDIYLPFIGVRHLKADEVMGKTVKCTYKVDILSGACVAWLDIDNHVMYTYQGQCASSVPITAGDTSNLIQGMINIVGGAVGGAIKGGVGGAIAGGVAAASAVAVTDGKLQVDRAGNIASTGGFLAYKYPFITINAPWAATPKNQHMFTGYPLYATKKIGNMSGYTEIDKINLTGVLGTEDEKAEIISLLKGGVYL